MPTYARREGGAYARGNVVTLVRHLGRRDLASQGPHGQRREPRVATKIFTDRNIEARRTIDHLGAERAYQGRLLLGSDILKAELSGPRLVLGDFNEWTRGLTSRLLSADLEAIKMRQFARRSRTYPGVLPLLHLDHIYHDRSLVLEHFSVYRTRLSLIASDHLPLVADFRVP